MRTCVVLLSGGQDSATCAAWAHEEFKKIYCVSFNYGQRHNAKELEAAKKIAALIGAKEHVTLDLPSIASNPASSLTNPQLSTNAESILSKELPSSFLPGRNLVFLTTAASWAISRGIVDLVTGVCQTDYNGYPDCRPKAIGAVQAAIFLGNHNIVKHTGFRIHTPLMHLTKKESVEFALRTTLGYACLGASWTCYEGGARPCGVCPACQQRALGFKGAGVEDPALK